MTSLPSLPDLTAIAFDGLDAASFLHGQLSSDVEGTPVGAAGWSSYNSAKGRVLATMLLWRRASDSFVAFVPPDIAEPLRKRLGMFVLRAKVAISTPTDVAHADASAWRACGIRDGIPMVTTATQDHFVAQALNLDLIGAVNFRKGCYPGQEIVARMQYLGRLKERTFAFHVDAPPPAAGSRIHLADSAVGTVINAVSATGGSDLLAVVQWDAIDGDLRLAGHEHASLARLTLPYAIPAPSAPNRVKL